MNPLPRSQQSRRRPQRAVGGVAIERPAHPRFLPGNLKLSICRLTRASAVFHVKQGGSRKRVVRGNEWFTETSGSRKRVVRRNEWLSGHEVGPDSNEEFAARQDRHTAM